MSEWVVSIFLILGTVFMLLAALGLVRMPDLYARMQTATKAVTLGVGCVFLAVGVHFREPEVTWRVVLIIVFFFLTSPVAAHMIARAAYFVGVPLWDGSHVDELRGRYDPETHTLRSSDSDSSKGAEGSELRRAENTDA